MSKDMINALVIDLFGTALLVLGILGYAGMAIHPALAQPEGYLTCGIAGLILSSMGTLKFVRILRNRSVKSDAHT